MNEDRFWSLIEEAWKSAGGQQEKRGAVITGSDDREAIAEELNGTIVDDVVPALRRALDELNSDELLEFDRNLERALYRIDREEIQQYTDGSDDGFLYCRGFIVAMGRQFYEAVDADPSRAIMDAECEEICYISWHMYDAKFGEMPRSGISRESCSNREGWGR